jgi:hypothetical protein
MKRFLRGKTHVEFSETEAGIYRLLHVIDGQVDRIQVSIALLKPFGSVSRVFFHFVQ